MARIKAGGYVLGLVVVAAIGAVGYKFLPSTEQAQATQQQQVQVQETQEVIQPPAQPPATVQPSEVAPPALTPATQPDAGVANVLRSVK